jgi:hypothetical protein
MSESFCNHREAERAADYWGATRIISFVLVTTLATLAGQRAERITLIPQLHSGETLLYQSHARIDRHVETTSSVAAILKPGEARQDVSLALRLLVQDARLMDGRLLVAGESTLEPADVTGTENPAPKVGKVSFTIGGDGSISRADGLEDLDAQQALTWQFWTSQFAFGWTLPIAGIKPGEKWKSDEVEKTPTPLANLVWERAIEYVENDKCPEIAEQQCAVFLVSSTLKQKSNPKDATPEDYRIRQLKTSGTAKGSNETVAYISLQTGLLVRATEDLQQSMSVTIAKADESNEVHYEIQVTSHFDTALAQR